MRTAVYALLYDGLEVYIGVSMDPSKRLKQHRAKRPEGEAITLKVLSWHDDRLDALTQEYDLICERLPPWNKTYRAKVARKAERYAKEYAEWEALAAKNKAAMDAAVAEFEASQG